MIHRQFASSHSSCDTPVWKQRVVVEVEPTGDRLAVLEDLRGERVLVLGDVPHLLEQRQVDVRLDVAHRARVAVPVPRAADVARLLDQPDAAVARLAQTGAHQETTEAAAHDRHLDVIEQRLAGESGFDVRVVDVVRELRRDLDVLVVGVWAEAPLTLLAVLLPERVRIEGDVADQFGDGWLDLHGADRTDASPRWPTRSATQRSVSGALRRGAHQGRGRSGRPGGSRRMC